MFQQQYYQGPNVVPIMQQRLRTVNNIIPSFLPILLGIIQLLLWITIIILEIMSIYYDAGRGTIYAGLWCSTIFFVTWVSMFCYLCCGKSAGCGKYLLWQNTINLAFTIILLIFTSLFVKDPCLCYGLLCHIPNWDHVIDIDDRDNDAYLCTSRTWQKLPVLKVLLACAVLMLICNIVFIATYLIISIRLRIKARSRIQTPDVAYQQQSGSVHWGGQPLHHPSNMAYSSSQHQQSYPIQNTQTPSDWPSAPPPYEMHAEKF